MALAMFPFDLPRRNALFGFGMRRQKLAYKTNSSNTCPPPVVGKRIEFPKQTAETEAKLGHWKENRPAASEQAAKRCRGEGNKPAVAEGY
ncbi:MAG: hypothetical protein ACLRSW_07385 [Christensenellaceae bacterium]